MTAPSYVNGGTAAGSSAASNLTLNLPASLIVGNLLIGMIQTVSDSRTFTWPAGWTPIIDNTSGSVSASLAYRVVAGGESNPNVTVAGGNADLRGQIWQFSGNHKTDPISFSHKNISTSSSQWTHAAQSVPDSQVLVLLAMMTQTTGIVTVTDPSGYTPRTNSSGNGSQQRTYTQVVTGPGGSTTAVTAGNLSGNNPEWGSFLVGINTADLYVYDNAEAFTLVNAMTTTPDDTRKGVIDDLVTALKAVTIGGSNAWATMNFLYVTGAHDEQAATLNWKLPSSFALATGGPTFTQNVGWAAGTLKDTGFIPSTHGSGISSGSVGIGFYRDDVLPTDTFFNTTSGTTKSQFRHFDNAGTPTKGAQIAGGTEVTTAATNAGGTGADRLHAAYRGNTSNVTIASCDGTTRTTTFAASTAVNLPADSVQIEPSNRASFNGPATLFNDQTVMTGIRNAIKAYIDAAQTPPPDTDADEGDDLAINFAGGTTVNSGNVSAFPFEVAGIDADVVTATATFDDGVNTPVEVDVSAGNGSYDADLSTLGDGTITTALDVEDDDTNTAHADGSDLTKNTAPPAESPSSPRLGGFAFGLRMGGYGVQS